MSRRAEIPVQRLWRLPGALAAMRSLAGLRIGPADVAIASYPRSGNTWLRHMLAVLLCGETSWKLIDEVVAPELIRGRRGRALLPGGGRLFKTHEPPPGRLNRAVYLIRDPRDVLVSQLHFGRWHGLETDADELLAGKARQIERRGTWEENVRAWTGAGHSGDLDLLLVPYERMHAEPTRVLARVACFLGLDPGEDEVRRAVAATDLDRLRRSERAERPHRFRGDSGGANAGHIREGRVGAAAEVLAPGQLERLEPQVELWKRLLAATEEAGVGAGR